MLAGSVSWNLTCSDIDRQRMVHARCGQNMDCLEFAIMCICCPKESRERREDCKRWEQEVVGKERREEEGERLALALHFLSSLAARFTRFSSRYSLCSQQQPLVSLPVVSLFSSLAENCVTSQPLSLFAHSLCSCCHFAGCLSLFLSPSIFHHTKCMGENVYREMLPRREMERETWKSEKRLNVKQTAREDRERQE